MTRSGRPVAELVPVQRPAGTATVLLNRWRHLPRVDPVRLKQEIDAVIDATL